VEGHDVEPSLLAFINAFFNFDVATRYLPEIAKGFWVTTKLGAATIVTGLLLGLVLAVIRAGQKPVLSFAIIVFADVFRALPPLVVIIILFFAFPYINISMSAFVATWLALSLVLAAFAEESIWSGILALPKGQIEASRSTGLTWFQTMRSIVLPQALRMTLAPLTNRVLAITKNTALGSVVALSDILNVAQAATGNSGNPTPLTLGALAYLLLFSPMVLFARWLEHHWKWRR
jgi:polar amino acid transport system permease protein